jgi:hypothetical protein
MQRLSLDLVGSPVPAWPGRLLLATAVLCALFSYQHYLAVSASNAAVQSELAQLDVANQKLQIHQTPTLSSVQLEIEQRRVQEVVSLLLLPWRDLFTALESASHRDVALLTIEPDHKKHLLRITAEAKNFDIVVGYLKRLGDIPQLKSVHLLRYEVREDDKQHPLRFTIEASWQLPS